MLQIQEKKEERAKIVQDARAIHEKAQSEKRDTTPEEQSEFDKMIRAAESLAKEVRRLEDLSAIELQERSDEEKKKEGKKEDRAIDLGFELSPEDEKRQCKIFADFLKNGARALGKEDIDFIRSIGPSQIREMSAFGDGQINMLAPAEFTTTVLKNLERRVAIRSRASVFSVNTLAGFYAPTMELDTEEADWTPELGRPSLANDFEMGRRELRPHQLTKRQLLPITLLQSSTMPIEKMASDRLSAKIGRTEENVFNTGHGAQQPLGLFTPSDYGIPTSRDYSCANTTTFSFDDLIGAKRSVRREYWPNCQWYFSEDAIGRLLLLKDGNGHYLWEASVRAGEPDIILGRPYFVSDYCPSTFTAGSYFGMYGDFSYYWIVDFAFTYLQRLTELYAETNQIALIIRRWLDGAPVLPEAFSRLKLHA